MPLTDLWPINWSVLPCFTCPCLCLPSPQSIPFLHNRRGQRPTNRNTSHPEAGSPSPPEGRPRCHPQPQRSWDGQPLRKGGERSAQCQVLSWIPKQGWGWGWGGNSDMEITSVINKPSDLPCGIGLPTKIYNSVLSELFQQSLEPR